MHMLKVTPHRYIDIDRIAEIRYIPLEDAEGVAIDLGLGPVVINPRASSLQIELKNGDTITLQADNADRVWAEYRQVREANDKTS